MTKVTVRAFFNSVKEGILGIIRHPLVTIASVTTILLMLIIMSAFFIFSVNARNIMNKLAQQPPIEVYMELQCSQAELDQMKMVLDVDSRVINYVYRDPYQNYEYFKSNLGSGSSILDDFDYNMYLPHTFNVQISDPALADEITQYLSGVPGVNKVAQESNVMSFLTEARRIVNIATVACFLVLFIISLFIISNMVRISVYSRANEIEIMKFVGATNSYIRLPYIVEGGIVGLISAGFAWVITCLVYRAIFYEAMEGVDLRSFYALLPCGSIMWMILAICVVMGVFIGGIGSGISVRKYIKV